MTLDEQLDALADLRARLMVRMAPPEGIDAALEAIAHTLISAQCFYERCTPVPSLPINASAPIIDDDRPLGPTIDTKGGA